MTYDEETAAVLRKRLDVVKTIDESAELSFMESAKFRLELLGALNRFDVGEADADNTLECLRSLHEQVIAVVLNRPGAPSAEGGPDAHELRNPFPPSAD